MSTYKEQVDAFVVDAVKIINESNGLEAAAEFLPSVFITAQDLAKEHNMEREEVLNDLSKATRLELYGE